MMKFLWGQGFAILPVLSFFLEKIAEFLKSAMFKLEKQA